MDVVALVLAVVGALLGLVGVALVVWVMANAKPQEEIADGVDGITMWFGGAVLLVAGTAMCVGGAGLQTSLMVFRLMTS